MIRTRLKRNPALSTFKSEDLVAVMKAGSRILDGTRSPGRTAFLSRWLWRIGPLRVIFVIRVCRLFRGTLSHHAHDGYCDSGDRTNNADEHQQTRGDCP